MLGNSHMSVNSFWSFTSVAGKILLLALAYFATGQLAMLLAIPPGFVSAVFPPVGVALAAVLLWGYTLLPGVFLGSLLLNLSLAVTSFEVLSWQHLLVASGIALGTCIQCACACVLIRRFVGFPNPLTEDRSIMRLLLIGGPLTCLISASVGTVVLYSQQIITPGLAMFSWWSWWIGDSIGVLIATPLMFIAFATPRETWRHRVGTVGLPLLLSCVVMVVVFFRTSADEQSRLQQRFHEQAKLMVQSIKAAITLHTTVVGPTERLFAASDNVGAEDFAIFVGPLVSEYPGIRAISWNVRVSAAGRPQFEAAMQANGLTGFMISERHPDQRLIPAAARADYYPVMFIEPLAENRRVLGYDVGSETVRHAAMQRARDAGAATLTAPLQLVQDDAQKTAMLLFYPVYNSKQPPVNVAARQQALRGYVVAVLQIADVIRAALNAYPPDSFQLQVLDVSTAPGQPLFRTSGLFEPAAIPASALPLEWQDEFDVGGRRFRIEVQPSEQFLRSQNTLQPWAILAGGLVLCSLLGGFLLSVTGRAQQVRQQVRQRTLELSGILDNAAEAILIFDSSGAIDRANAAAQQLFGYSAAQFATLHIGAILPGLQHHHSALQAWQGRPQEIAGLSATQSPLELEVSLSNYVLPDHTWYICLLHDISERKKVERLKQEFVATVSHELRTPLTSIKGALQLLSAGVLGPVPASAAEMLDLARQNADRLAALVNDILDIEKLALAGTTLPLQPLDLRQQLNLALQQNQGYADNFSVRLSLDDSQLPQTMMVLAHQQRLQQVLSNLISNAVKFSAAGSVVHISAECKNQQARIKVIDQGPGIAEDFRPRIFEKFAQADSSDARQRGGTGLGLSICKELMSRMHGTIGFDSVAGKGSTFYITLPLAGS